MGRRCFRNKYSRPGIYHITIPVNEAWHEPLSRIVGSLDKADGDPDAPHVVLSLVGQMVEQELTTSKEKTEKRKAEKTPSSPKFFQKTCCFWRLTEKRIKE